MLLAGAKRCQISQMFRAASSNLTRLPCAPELSIRTLLSAASHNHPFESPPCYNAAFPHDRCTPSLLTSRPILTSLLVRLDAEKDSKHALSRRGICVEVRDGDLDRAIKKWKSKNREDNTFRLARARQYYWKPSELKVLRQKELEIRWRNIEFKKKLKIIMEKKNRGF